MQEHDYEPAPGLPEALPVGERLLWQGRSEFKSIARSTFHVRKLAVYFIALLALRLALQLQSGQAVAATLGGSIGLLTLAVVALGMLLLYSKLIAGSTMFTVTDQRIIIRAGVAVPVTVNLPFSRIEALDLRLHADGSGDIAILTEANSRVSYVLLWPYVKPWRFMRVRPVLRGVAEVEKVASLLCDALATTAQGAGETKARPERAAPRDPSAEASRNGRRRWLAYPTFPLASAGSLVIIALVAVAFLQTGERSSEGQPVTPNIVMEVRLFFEDKEDGSVVVTDAGSGATIDILEPGTNGFLRSTMRTFVHERKAVHVGNEAPFSVKQTEDGRLILADPATGREVDLWAFGETNARAFMRFLTPEVVATINGSAPPRPEATTLTYATQETTP